MAEEGVKSKEFQLGTLMQFNRQAMEQMKPLPKNVFNAKMLKVSEWMANNIGSKYFMLLSNEQRDYTIINLIKNNYSKAIDEIAEVINSRGELLSIDKFENTFEVWIKSPDNNVLFYLLFPCDDFVIEVE